MSELISLCNNTKKASSDLLSLSDQKINKILFDSARLIRENVEFLKVKNVIDIENAKILGRTDSFIDRLKLTDSVIESVAIGIEQVASLTTPVGQTVYSYINEAQGIDVKKINVPFGVVGIIYEARPNVTADAFALCLKTKNAVILKGGSDAINSNVALVKILKEALEINGVNQNAVNIIEDTSRETAKEFMKMNEYVDLLIPRGSASLIKATIENSTIPVIETGAGNCHVYVDEFADIDKAVEVIYNAKTQRYSTCNTCESLVIHSKILSSAMPKISAKLKEKNVEIRCDERSIMFVDGGVTATEEDFYTEYGSAIISVKTVDSLDEAISHINKCSTRHSESIITEKSKNAEEFILKIDSACVYHNASTRFSDGFVFGLGAEIGISTQKLHARGPMGLNALVTEKYVIKGDGAVRK